MYGAAATAENDFGYDWHPKILGTIRTSPRSLPWRTAK